MGGDKPPWPLSKKPKPKPNTSFSINGENSAQKLGKKEKNGQNPFQAILRIKKKREAWTTKPLGEGAKP